MDKKFLIALAMCFIALGSGVVFARESAIDSSGARQAFAEAQQMQKQIEMECRKNLQSCNCERITDPEGKSECERAIIEVKYKTEKERDNKIRDCSADIERCNCKSIQDGAGKQECEIKLNQAKALKQKIETACRGNPINCDCSVIESTEGKAQCATAKQQGMQQAEDSIKLALSKCFKDVEACDCNNLGLEKQEYIDFCSIQKSYGLNCKHEGLQCDKLENVEIYPPGMPPWLGTLFAKSYKDLIEAEKQKGVKQALNMITRCLNNPAQCNCQEVPAYARAFCEKNRVLQTKCEAGDYDACIILDQTENVPEGLPSFSFNLIDKLVNSLRTARKQLIMSDAARKVGNMILACMDNAASCDCSLAPQGAIKTFCEHKKTLVGLCREGKQYGACFTLDEEANYPPETPGIIRAYIEKFIEPKIAEKKQMIFDQMKQGTVCENIATLSECKQIYQ